ncbi:MAG: dihydroneopterin aldolase [Chloroflexota bacterium]
MDEIALAGLTFFGTHGANPEETELGQRFGLDFSLWLDLSVAAKSDTLDDTVSYSAIYKLVRREMEGTPSKLLEHLAGRITSVLLAHDTRIQRVKVRVTKLSPPLKGMTTGEVAVILDRTRAIE